MTLPEAYARLREHFGSHGTAAKHIGMTEQHYNALRNGRANMPERTKDYILLKATNLGDCPVPAVPPEWDDCAVMVTPSTRGKRKSS